MVDVTKIKSEQTIFNESWRLLKKYYELGKSDDERWTTFVSESQELYEKFEGTEHEQLAKDVIIGVITHVGKISAIRKLEVEDDNNCRQQTTSWKA